MHAAQAEPVLRLMQLPQSPGACSLQVQCLSRLTRLAELTIHKNGVLQLTLLRPLIAYSLPNLQVCLHATANTHVAACCLKHTRPSVETLMLLHAALTTSQGCHWQPQLAQQALAVLQVLNGQLLTHLEVLQAQAMFSGIQTAQDAAQTSRLARLVGVTVLVTKMDFQAFDFNFSDTE